MIYGYYELAKQIPAEFRATILLGNFIYKALPNEDDPDMIRLYIFYANYIEPNSEVYKYADGKIIGGCKLCLTKILDKFKLLEPYLIMLEKENTLLEL